MANPIAIIAIVDKDKCTGCGICADACPQEAIKVDEVAVVDKKRCTGCGACVQECPNEAISMSE